MIPENVEIKMKISPNFLPLRTVRWTWWLGSDRLDTFPIVLKLKCVFDMIRQL